MIRVLTHLPLPRLDRLAGELGDVEMVTVPGDGEPAAGVEGEVLLTLPWGTPNLAAVLARGVRWIHTVGTGVDRFPLDLLGDRVLSCSRGASGVPIAEWALAMMLAFEKHLPESWITEAPQRWHSPLPVGTLEGKTLGVIGLGGIGRELVARAAPFGMRILASRRTPKPSPHPHVELAALDDVLAAADHLVLAVPSTPTTRRIIDERALALVKHGVHLVNVARGTLVDQDALRAALDSGRVARASLDAVDPEPLPAGHWLYTHPSVRVSPHVSWAMPEALDRLIDTFEANLRRYRAGEPLEGLVDVAEGY